MPRSPPVPIATPEDEPYGPDPVEAQRTAENLLWKSQKFWGDRAGRDREGAVITIGVDKLVFHSNVDKSAGLGQKWP